MNVVYRTSEHSAGHYQGSLRCLYIPNIGAGLLPRAFYRIPRLLHFMSLFIRHRQYVRSVTFLQFLGTPARLTPIQVLSADYRSSPYVCLGLP